VSTHVKLFLNCSSYQVRDTGGSLQPAGTS
jgi:hypothetical protein